MLARDLPCVVLAVDPGATSGWALTYVLPGEPYLRTWSYAVAETWQDRSFAADQAHVIACTTGLPLVVVAETWRNTRPKGGRPFPMSTAVGLGAQWGKWLAEIERLDVPAKRILRVDTGTWGQAVLGRSRLTTEQRRVASMLRARAVLGRDVTHDEAAALCIGLWALRAEATAKAIGKRELKRLGWSEC